MDFHKSIIMQELPYVFLGERLNLYHAYVHVTLAIPLFLSYEEKTLLMPEHFGSMPTRQQVTRVLFVYLRLSPSRMRTHGYTSILIPS